MQMEGRGKEDILNGCGQYRDVFRRKEDKSSNMTVGIIGEIKPSFSRHR